MQKTKKSHCIPKLLIKRFCDVNGNIYKYNIETKKIKKTGSNDGVFWRDWLYSFYENDENGNFKNSQDNEIENLLGLMENEIPKILEKIDSGNNLDVNEKDVLRLFCLLQWARTPSAISISNESLSNVYKSIMSLQFEFSLKDELTKYLKSENISIGFDKPCIPALQLAIKLFIFSGQTELEFNIIKTEQLLIFGENPVIVKLPMINGVEVVMPISSHQLLYIHSINVENKIKDIIDALNIVQINQTSKYIFFKEKPCNLDMLLTLRTSLQFGFPNIT